MRFWGTGSALEAVARAGCSLLDTRAILLYTSVGRGEQLPYCVNPEVYGWPAMQHGKKRNQLVPWVFSTMQAIAALWGQDPWK